MFASVYHEAASGSLDYLVESYKHLEDEANNSDHLDFGIAVTNTENFREYSFSLNSRGGKIPVRFSDFPGGWLNAPESDKERENSAKLDETVGRSEVIFVAVSAPYLMEYDGKFSASAKIDEIQTRLRQAIQNSDNDRLILIVPMKCEKYMKEFGKLLGRIKDAFSETIELAGINNKRVALAVIPISTIGNAKFSRFDFEGEKIAREFFSKQANSKFNPENTDQPLRFAMSFFLNHFSLPDDLKKIADDIQTGIKWDCAEILSGEGLITGEAITQRRSLDGTDENPDDILIKPKELPIKPKKPNEYKIAVMGAQGVGKTVFLGSYFKLAYDDGKGYYTVDIHSQDAANRVHNLIRILFNEKRRVAGTSQRTDFSFSVNDKKAKMDIELFDVEGGITTDIDSWVQEKILPDLLKADGALFFISGYDLVNNREKILKDNIVFSHAISLLRENKEADIPIQFIITKGDKIPDVSLDDLKRHIAVLLKHAANSPHAESLLESQFFRKGKYVNVYKTEAMGKWPSDDVLPENYEPKNVTEPIDDLITLMYKSRHEVSRTKRFLAGTAAVIVAAVLWGGLYFWDHQRWSRTLDNVEQSLRKSDYASAQKMLEEFESPSFLSVIYPKFLRADSRINDGYTKYEAALYSLIQSDLATVDEDELPAMTQDFINASGRVDHYLSVKIFAAIAPEHYENVSRKKLYFTFGKLFNYDTSASRPEDIMSVIQECLSMTTPESWRERVSGKIDGLVRAWCNALPPDAAPGALESYITAADSLISSQNMPARTKDYLNSQKKLWNESQNRQWEKIADEYIRSAGKDTGRAIKFLEHKLKESPSPVAVKRIRAALEAYYADIAGQWIAEYRNDTDIPKLRGLMNDYPGMTGSAKEKLSKWLEELEKVRIDKTASNLLNDARSIEELSARYVKLGADAKNKVIQDAVLSAMRGLMKDEFNKIRDKAAGFLKDGRFSDARADVTSRCNLLRTFIRPITASRGNDSALSEVDEFERKLKQEIHDTHLNLCRQEFNSDKNSHNPESITACIDTLNDFVRTWPDSSDTETVRGVLDFLRAIQNGVQGKIYIGTGDFSAADSFRDTPDVYVTVTEREHEIFRSEVMTDTRKPDFKGTINYSWQINNAPITFSAFDNNVWSDELLLRQEVIVSGFFGYQNLSTMLMSKNGCSLNIRFSGNIPPCPWQ